VNRLQGFPRNLASRGPPQPQQSPGPPQPRQSYPRPTKILTKSVCAHFANVFALALLSFFPHIVRIFYAYFAHARGRRTFTHIMHIFCVHCACNFRCFTNRLHAFYVYLRCRVHVSHEFCESNTHSLRIVCAHVARTLRTFCAYGLHVLRMFRACSKCSTQNMKSSKVHLALPLRH
jgi:hypothetical protein